MEDQAFTLLMSRFDTLEDQGKATQALVADHIKDSALVHKTVERHSAYFGVVGLGVTPLLGWLEYKLGFRH